MEDDNGSVFIQLRATNPPLGQQGSHRNALNLFVSVSG